MLNDGFDLPAIGQQLVPKRFRFDILNVICQIIQNAFQVNDCKNILYFEPMMVIIIGSGLVVGQKNEFKVILTIQFLPQQIKIEPFAGTGFVRERSHDPNVQCV